MVKILSLTASLVLIFQLHAIVVSAQQKDTSNQKNIAWDELNPRAIGFVKDYLSVHQDRLTKMKEWGAPYFLVIENILKRYHLPASLKYLAVIESDLKTTALSSAGAVGPWQLMPETAKELGLTVTKQRDDRTDLNKSTHAAARFLSMLHEQLDDWLLVVAAYNGGPARLDNIIKRKDKKDFWEIQNELPLESRNHVKKFIATHFIFEGQGSETTGKVETVLKPQITAEELKNIDSIDITGRYRAEAIIKILPMDSALFHRWNPLFDEKVSAERYRLKVPKEKKPTFYAKQPELLKASVILMMREGNNMPVGFPPAISLQKEVTEKPQKKKKG